MIKIGRNSWREAAEFHPAIRKMPGPLATCDCVAGRRRRRGFGAVLQFAAAVITAALFQQACSLCGGVGGRGAAARSFSDRILANPAHQKPITVWFDATANWTRLGTAEQVGAIMDKCVEAGVDVVVIDVKPISGYVLYNSALAPHMTEWKGVRRDGSFDLLDAACREGHRRGLRVFASVNVFAEGHYGAAGIVPKHGTVLSNPERKSWLSVDYVVLQGDSAPQLLPADQVNRGHAIFVSATNPEVVGYELALVDEICRYPIDGISLDRLRFSGITADFSPWARRSFEAYLGRRVEHWPEDIYTYKRVRQTESALAPSPADAPDSGERAARGMSTDWDREPGPLYKEWLVWRAKTIRDLLLRFKGAALAANPRAAFTVYTGSWYPDYYNEGVNWASPHYDPSADYEWAAPNYQQTAYAHLLDALYSGWYYTRLTEEEARADNQAAWGSIEGASNLIARVVRGDCPVYGGLYLFQYKDKPELFQKCMRRTYDLSDGLMLFDLVYLEEYSWWDLVKTTFPERLEGQKP